jgi:hypothetical protein
VATVTEPEMPAVQGDLFTSYYSLVDQSIGKGNVQMSDYCFK